MLIKETLVLPVAAVMTPTQGLHTQGGQPPHSSALPGPSLPGKHQWLSLPPSWTGQPEMLISLRTAELLLVNFVKLKPPRGKLLSPWDRLTASPTVATDKVSIHIEVLSANVFSCSGVGVAVVAHRLLQGIGTAAWRPGPAGQVHSML